MKQEITGPRTRFLLLTCLVLVIAGSTTASLLMIRSRLRSQVREAFSADLQRSLTLFHSLQIRRRTSLHQINALIANLPSLKALMTTHDIRTVADGSITFWETSGNDLFVLTDRDFEILAFNARHASSQNIQKLLAQQLLVTSQHYLLADHSLYEYAIQPIYFGDSAHGTSLGYLVGGYEIDRAFLQDVAKNTGSEIAFFVNGQLLTSSLPDAAQNALRQSALPLKTNASASVIQIEKKKYLAIAEDSRTGFPLPVQLLVMKSFSEAEHAEQEINRLIAIAGLLAFAVGVILMLLLSHMLTWPIERLASCVRAFGSGEANGSLPTWGTQEILYLSGVFAQMREQIQKANKALLESERLATIGRMANSVSHDLRHYLAAVYANAEFLASPALSSTERQELYDEIRTAVQGTTDMLDSLLIFGRTGDALHPTFASVQAVAERAISLIRAHPDSDGVCVSMQNAATEPSANMDVLQIERAIYNLLLNACQSVRGTTGEKLVLLTLEDTPDTVSVRVVDTGPGVPEAIRDSMFAPFVSQDRQKGTGLGLTLVWSVAREHGGKVTLADNRAGSTTFVFTIAKHLFSDSARRLSSKAFTP